MEKTKRDPMTWISSRKLWKKIYRGQKTEFPCRKMGWPLTREGSRPYMRETWKQRKAELDGLIERRNPNLDDPFIQRFGYIDEEGYLVSLKHRWGGAKDENGNLALFNGLPAYTLQAC